MLLVPVINIGWYQQHQPGPHVSELVTLSAAIQDITLHVQDAYSKQADPHYHASMLHFEGALRTWHVDTTMTLATVRTLQTCHNHTKISDQGKDWAVLLLIRLVLVGIREAHMASKPAISACVASQAQVWHGALEL